MRKIKVIMIVMIAGLPNKIILLLRLMVIISRNMQVLQHH